MRDSLARNQESIVEKQKQNKRSGRGNAMSKAANGILYRDGWITMASFSLHYRYHHHVENHSLRHELQNNVIRIDMNYKLK